MDHQAFPASLRSSFEPISILGQGGMGAVWSAKRLSDGQKVAIKVLLPHLHTDETFRRRFSREALVGQQIEHPGLVCVLDSGVVAEQAYIVSQFVEGQSLDKVLEHYGALEEGAAIDVVLQVGRALGALHQIGVIHRDIKPENVIVQNNGRVKVLDFGLARCLEEGQTVTQTGVVVGTPAFMAPEVCCGTALDPRVDVFSVGLLFIACLEGKKSIQDSEMSPLELLKKRAVHKETPQLPQTYNRLLRRLVGNATAFSPAERFPDCNAFVAALEEYRKPREEEQETDKVGKVKKSAPKAAEAKVGLPAKALPTGKIAFAICFLLFLFILALTNEAGEKQTSTQSTFITMRQSLLRQKGRVSDKKLASFAKLQARHAPVDDFPTTLTDKERALAYLGRFLRRSWENREDGEKKAKLAHRTADFYLHFLSEKPNLTSSAFDQTVLHDTYRACVTSRRYDELLDKLPLLNLAGTIAFARDFYVARTIFKKTEQDLPQDHETRDEPHSGFIESDKVLRPLVERLTRGPFDPPLVHIKVDKVLEAYSYLHHHIRLQSTKRQMLAVVRQLTSAGSLLLDEIKVEVLIRAQGELSQDNRGRKIDDPFISQQEIDDALECIKKAQSLCKDKRKLNHLLFLEANVYRRDDDFRKAHAALAKVDPNLLYETTLFEYYLKSGYILSGVNRYGPACVAFKKAQLHAKSEEDLKHAKLQWDKARLKKAYDEARRGR